MNARQAKLGQFWIGAKGGLLDEKHVRLMGDSVWLFLYLLRGQTGVNQIGEGMFQYGHPLTIRQIASDFGGTSEWTIQRWVGRLRKAGYIHTEAHSEKGLTFWISKAKDKTKKPRVTTDSPRKLQAKSVAKSDKLSTFVYTTPQVNHLPSESQSIGESPAELIQSIGESPADSKTESLQSNNNTGLTEIFENPTPKDSIPKSPFYYNTPAAPPNISLLLEGTAKKLQPQEKPFCLEERQRQLQEQSKAILAKYPPKSSKKAWEEIRSVGYGPVGKEATA